MKKLNISPPIIPIKQNQIYSILLMLKLLIVGSGPISRDLPIDIPLKTIKENHPQVHDYLIQNNLIQHFIPLTKIPIHFWNQFLSKETKIHDLDKYRDIITNKIKALY